MRTTGKTHKNTNAQIYKLSGILQDLTERKEIEEQLVARSKDLEKLNYTTGKIYSVIGHDLRSPMNAITGFAELLLADFEDDGKNKGARKNLEIIYQSTHKMSGLLNDLLSWARIQTGDMNLFVEELPMIKIVEETIALLSVSAQQKDIGISFLPSGVKQVKGDERMITTIIRNLLSNAIKYSRIGGQIEIALGTSSESWFLAAKDRGVGISQEAQSNLFTKKINKSTRGTANEKGTGLGLILCIELAEMHDGSIEIDSEDGKGSTFTLRIPFEVEEKNKAKIRQTDQPAG